MKYNSTALTAIKALQGAPLRAGNMMLLLLLLISFGARAQFVSSLTAQSIYPTTGTAGLNLDRMLTKYLSNFSFPGTGPLMNTTIQVAGWSTDNDGGFSYSREMSIFPYTFTGDGAVAIPNARDVQVGILKFSGNYYIIAAYYDVIKEMYAYDLYDYAFTPPSIVNVNKLYTYFFISNDGVMALPYTPTTDYSHGTPVLPDPRMGYNRISMDINKDGDKVAIVMSNGDDSRMYLAVGQSGMDTIIFSPNLPPTPITPTATTSAGIEYAAPTVLYSGGGGWTPNGGDWDYTDMSTGVPIYVRYLASSSGNYLYSYYPIDDNIMIRIADGTGLIIGSMGAATAPYCPLIGIKAGSLVSTPGLNPYFNQIWPDVCFNGSEVRMVCYINNPEPGVHFYTLQPHGAEDLYVSDGWDFSDFYNYTGITTGVGAFPTYTFEGQNHVWVSFFNTFDGKPLRESPTSMMAGTWWTTYDFESLCKSLPLVPGEDIRAKIDGADLSSDDYAITFAYSGVPSGGYSAFYPETQIIGSHSVPKPPGWGINRFDPVHNPSEFGKSNIYLRYGVNNTQAILTNNSIAGGHAAINTQQNLSPCVSFKPMSNNRFSVAWVSEQAGSAGNYSYVGVEIDKSVAYGAAGYRVSPASYLRLPNTPSLSNPSGITPVVSLSKHQDGLSRLYTCFAQEDATPLYSIVHKSHDWAVSSTWRSTEEGSSIMDKELAVGPNPFSNSLHISSSNEIVSVVFTDALGKYILSAQGSSEELNRQLDNVAAGLASGPYLLNVAEGNKGYQTFKLTKQ